MEALIWQHDSTDGADHGAVVRRVRQPDAGTGRAGRRPAELGDRRHVLPVAAARRGPTCRVDPNPASPGIVSVLQDAQAHHRWHPLGDGYQPQPGDWVLFDGHVEVVTEYAGGVLHTIGGDSLPNFSVNAHEYPGPLRRQGVAGFVDNGL